MQKYINQIIQILNQAEQDAPPMEAFSGSEFEFEMQMELLESDARVPLDDRLGITFEELPPADKMTEEQTQQLSIALLNALEANGTGVHFPGNGIPAKVAYTELLKYLKDGIMALKGWNLDFCDGWCPDCVFADYCTTKDDIWSKEDLEAERKKNT